MHKNVLKLEKKYTNVLDLHDRKRIALARGNVVDLQERQRARDRAAFEKTLSNKLYQGKPRPKKRKLSPNYFSFIEKTVAILLIMSQSAFTLSSIGTTFSIFNDIELSENNTHTAGIIDFTLELSPFSNDAWQNLVEGTSTAQDVDVMPNVDSTDLFFYFASSSNLIGDEAFCDAINVLATLDGDIMYDGPLSGLLTATTTVIDIWNLEFSNDQKFFNSVCQFDIDFNGWQIRHDYPQYHDGFSDTEKTTHTLFSDGLKINKVYFEVDHLMCRMDMDDHFLTEDDPRLDRDGRDRQDRREIWPHPDRDCYDDRGRENSARNSTTTQETNATSTATSTLPAHEWVEIYNPNDEPADIDGWFLCDGEACDELNAPDPIPPLGFAIVVGNLSHLNGWITPSDFVIIVALDGVIGDGLDNENDALFLRRPDFFTFDQINWGIPDPLWPYFVPELWNPGIASTTDGTMIARIPTGFDTNQPSDFEVLYIPSIELLYPGDIVDHKWFWGFTYLVTWEATNPNGDDSELLIDIWMIRDTNGNGQPDGEDEHLLLVEKTENDGNEEVTVPEGFLGTIWIKIIATGPENPMAHGFDFSGPIDDPIPPHMLDDDDEKSIEMMQQAVIDQINREGTSDFSHILIEPHVPEEQGTTTATTTETISNNEEENDTATTTEETVEQPEIEPTEDESSTASSTDEISEETEEEIPPTFEEEIHELIEEFIEEYTPEEPAEEESSENSTTTPVIIEEEEVEPAEDVEVGLEGDSEAEVVEEAPEEEVIHEDNEE